MCHKSGGDRGHSVLEQRLRVFRLLFASQQLLQPGFRGQFAMQCVTGNKQVDARAIGYAR